MGRHGFEGNYTFVCGSVKNIGNVAISYFEVNVKYIDVNKNVLDSDFTNYEDIEKERNIFLEDRN